MSRFDALELAASQELDLIEVSPMAEPPPPAPLVPPPAIAKPPSRLRVWIPLIVIFGFLGVVLWMTRDYQSAGDLSVGTCFDVPTGESVSTVTKRPCTEAHDAEVFHVTEYPNQDTYPISLNFSSFASDACAPDEQCGFTPGLCGKGKKLDLHLMRPPVFGARRRNVR